MAVRPAPPTNAGVVTARGEVDLVSAGVLADRIEHTRLRFATVVVDLSGVTFFSAAGITVLLTEAPTAVVCSPAVLKVITACGLEDRWELHRSVFMALAAGVSTGLAATSASPELALRAAGARRG